MSTNKIAVATSIFQEKNFDSFATIEYCKENNISFIQLYLSTPLEKERDKIEAIRQACIENELTVICHSPHYLNKDIIDDGRHIASLNLIFPKNQRKYVVVHFDERISVAESVTVIQKLNKNGFTVCVENFHITKTKEALVQNLNSFNNLMIKIAEENLDCIPVIDLPRLFIKEFEEFNSLFLSELLLNNISRIKKEIILHMVDFTDSRQAREDWCAVSKGIMPYERLFTLLKQYEIQITAAVLEFETVPLATESLPILNELLLPFQ